MSGSFTKALVALLGVAAPAAATWNGAHSFCAPGNPHKPAPVCSSHQADGWDWSGFDGGYGSICSQYDSVPFQCQNGAHWKFVPDLFSQTSDFRGRGLEARTGDGLGCMAADLVNFPSYGSSNGRTFDAASFLVVSEVDVDLELVFAQADGTSCSQYARCSRHGSSIQNTQCGNATSVTFKHRHGGGSCGLGVSSVSYASCTSTTTFPPPPATSTTYSAPPTTVATTTSSVALTTSSTSTTYSSIPSSTSSVPSTSIVTSSTTPVASTSTTVVSSVVTTSSVSTVLITTATTVTSCGSSVTDCPASSTVVSSSVITSYTTVPVTVPTTIATVTTISTSTAVAVTTMYVTTSTTICPVTATQTKGNTTIFSTFLTTSYVPVTITTTTTASGTPPAQISAAPAPSSTPSKGCPSSVPSCLNTWLYLVPDCKDNTDAKCFCAVANYTEAIIDCLDAYSGEDVSDAISYFQGICAPYASSNPQPFTGVPSTITVTAPAVPQTTVYITQSGTTSTVTVPAVTFTTTAQAGSSSAAGLAPIGGSTTSTIAIVPAGSSSSTSVAVGGSAPAPTTAVAAPPAQQSSVAVGTGAFTATSPSSSQPVIATGAASSNSKFASGAMAFAAIVVALVL